MLKTNPCKQCGSVWHTAWQCPLLPRKAMNKTGSVQKKTAQAVANWKKTQKPNHQGYYQCYICGRWIPYLEAEHVKSKVRHPELRTDMDNLRPVCDPCNEKKGSKPVDNTIDTNDSGEYTSSMLEGDT